MTFQEFNHYSERRKAERAQKIKKRITIGVGACIIVIVAIVSCIVVLGHRSKHQEHKNASPAGHKPSEVSHIQKGVKTICGYTDFKNTCESSLTKVIKSNSSSQTMDLVKAAITVIGDEIEKAFTNSTKTNQDDPKVTGAIEDCEVLLRDAKEELGLSESHVGSMDKKSHDLNNWLSAVMSYQQTCIDGFPEGKFKSTLQANMKTAKELTSNALAIISAASTILSALSIPGLTHRRLLAEESNGPSLEEDGFPSWITHEDRRMLKGATTKLKPNVVVAKDGSGDFKTITEALTAMPKEHKERYIIYVKGGIYEETVEVSKKMVNVTIYGDGSQKTIVTGSKNFVDGVRTFQTATFAALGEGFIAQAMGFRNTAGPEKHQAVALRVQADRSVFVNCRMEGYQDTLYAQTHRQFYRSCVIAGTVDFIFGDAAVIFQNCLLVVRKPLDNQQNIVTAQGRIDKRETTGIVIQNCKIQADDKLNPVKATIKSYLGRPWKEYSRTIIMESEIGDHIHPNGWLPWEGDFALKTLYYAEYDNKGPGASTTARVKWPGRKVITKEEALKYTVEPFLQGDWVKASGAAVHMGLYA